jgi:hypothetical protein
MADRSVEPFPPMSTHTPPAFQVDQAPVEDVNDESRGPERGEGSERDERTRDVDDGLKSG